MTRFRVLKNQIQHIEVESPASLFLSDNSKTGFSINTAVTLTCRPTPACVQYCYGLEGRSRMNRAIYRQISNVHRFRTLATAPNLTLITEALNIGERVLRHQKFLRLFGVGDMSSGAVRFINTLAMVIPELHLWVSTRRFDLVHQLGSWKNLHVMLGLDSTTRAIDMADVKQLLRNRQMDFFASWVQREEKERIPPWVSVIFAEHHMQHRAKWTKKSIDARICPATIVGGAKHDNACIQCQRCFNKEKR